MEIQRISKRLTLRNLTQLEATTPELFPPELREWQFPYLDKDWAWLVEEDGKGPISLIITSPVHGVLFFWRVLATANALIPHLLVSLPKILENAKVRGCVCYASFLHDDRPQEVKIARIIQRHGGLIEGWKGMLAVNTLYPELGVLDAGFGDRRNTGDSVPSSGGDLDRGEHL